MPETAENYIPQDLNRLFRRQAISVWAGGVVVVLLWVLLILLPPVALHEGWQNISNPLYRFFGYICHQIPERSFHVFGHQFGVCSRCFGVYFGLLLGFGVYPLWRPVDSVEPPARMWLFLSLIPIGIDWSLGVFGIWENTHLSRFITGLILGVACATYIVPALVDIWRNLSRSRVLVTESSIQKPRSEI
jgi:uncharacterized membrane protein